MTARHRYAERGRAILTAPGDGRDRLGQLDAWVDGHSLKDRCSQCHLNPWQIHLRVVHDNSWSIHVGKTSKFKMQREAEECEKSYLGYLRTLGPVQNALPHTKGPWCLVTFCPVQNDPMTASPHQRVLDGWSCLKAIRHGLITHMDVLNRTKHEGSFGEEQVSYRPIVLWTFWKGISVY